MKTIEEAPQALTFTKQQMDDYFRSAEGQQALRQSRMPDKHKPRAPMSEEEQDKWCKIGEKTDIRYIRIDPKTGVKLTEPEGEETFWRILNIIPEAVGNSESELRINFFMQRYYKGKTYKRSISPTDATQVEENEPYIVKATNRFSKMFSIVELGDRICDAEDFSKQYKRDED